MGLSSVFIGWVNTLLKKNSEMQLTGLLNHTTSLLMPDKLADHRQRVSFAENKETIEQLKHLAAVEGKTLTDIYAEAAQLLLKTKLKPKSRKTKHQ
jgi:hypothetical protein